MKRRAQIESRLDKLETGAGLRRARRRPRVNAKWPVAMGAEEWQAQATRWSRTVEVVTAGLLSEEFNLDAEYATQLAGEELRKAWADPSYRPPIDLHRHATSGQPAGAAEAQHIGVPGGDTTLSGWGPRQIDGARDLAKGRTPDDIGAPDAKKKSDDSDPGKLPLTRG